ncbi:hypothetical protein PHLCEN_2v7959, partial [Hermanssonia centrifuga]
LTDHNLDDGVLEEITKEGHLSGTQPEACWSLDTNAMEDAMEYLEKHNIS